MRFDDTIATVLAQPADRPDRWAAQWRQLVDLLAQRRTDADPIDIERAFDFLRRHRHRVEPAARGDAARALAGLPIDGDLLVYFAEDMPSIPLYRRTLNWAMKKNVRAVQWPSDSPELRWLRVHPQP